MQTDPTTLISVLAEWAANTPDRPFILELDGTKVTYGQTMERARLWAAAWARLGVAAGDHVVTMQLNSTASLTGWLGLASLQAVEVPVNTDYEGAQLAHTINLPRASLAAMSTQYARRLAAIADQLPLLKTVVLLDSDEPIDLPFKVITRAELFDGVVPVGALRQPKPWEIAIVLFTSGTTGPSKAVRVPWGHLHSCLALIPIGDLTSDEVFYNAGPSYHLGSRTQAYKAAFVGGAQVMLPAMNPAEMGDIYLRFGVTTGHFPASWLSSPPEGDSRFVFKNAYGGSPALHRMKGRLGVRTHAGYGSTEVSVPLRDGEWDNPVYDERGRLSVGKLREGYPGFEVRVVDKNDQPLPPGQVGELIMRTDAPWVLNAGYLNMPEKTVEAWRNGWFHTGDAFVYDENGSYYFVDRMGDFLGAHHQNVSSFEIEAHVSQHPAVAASAAVLVALPDDPQAPGAIKAVAILKPGAELTPADLAAWLMERMPEFMIPRYIEFVDAFPLTPTMKVRKVQLRADGVTQKTWDRLAMQREDANVTS